MERNRKKRPLLRSLRNLAKSDYPPVIDPYYEAFVLLFCMTDKEKKKTQLIRKVQRIVKDNKMMNHVGYVLCLYLSLRFRRRFFFSS